MKKSFVAVLLIVGLIAAFNVVPAQAKKKAKPRVVEFEYTMGGIGISTPAASIGACPMTEPGSGQCIEFPVMSAKEKYVKVEVLDTVPVGPAGFISQGDVDGDGIADGYGTFCRAHEDFIPLEGGTTPVRVSFYPGTCDDGTPSIPTTGTIRITFSKTP